MKTLLRSTLVILPAFAICLASMAVAAPEAKPADKSPSAEKLIEQLTGNSFKGRVEASKKLYELGATAIEPLQKGAETLELDGATRCFQILKRLSESNDDATADAAKAALKKIAANENSPVAKRAADALKPKVDPNQPRFPNNPFGPRIIIGGGGGLLPGGNFQRNVSITENGKTIKISEDNNGITVTVTEEVDGKKKTETFKGKNAADLKKKHPKAHALYQKHMAKNGKGGIRINGRAIPFRIQRIRPNVRPFRIPRNRRGNNKNIQVQEENGKRRIKSVENGRTIEVQDEDGKNIIIRITPKAIDEAAKIIKAKDLEDLKKKDKKAAEQYERLNKEAKKNAALLPGAPNIQVLPFGPNGNALPAVPNFPFRGANNKKMNEAQQELRKALQALMDAMRNQQNDPNAVQKAREEMQKAQKKIIESIRNP